jgi:hypothetical protein
MITESNKLREAASTVETSARWVGIGGALLIVVAVISVHTSLMTFFDWTGLGITLGSTFALLVGVFGWNGSARALRTLLRGETERSRLSEAVTFFRLGAAISLGSGCVGMIVGLIVMLQNMSDASQLGPAAATALLSQFYGVLLAGLMLTASSILSRRRSANAMSRRASGTVAVAAAATAVGGLGAMLVIGVISVVVMDM